MDKTKESSPDRISRWEFLRRSAKSATGLGGIALSRGRGEALRRGLENLAKIGAVRRGLEAAAGVAGIAAFSCGSYKSESEPQSTPTIEIDQSYQAEGDVEDSYRLKPLTETDIPPKFEFYFKDNVSESDRKTIEESAKFAHAFFHREIGIYVKGTVRYSVENGPSIGHPAAANGTSVTINTGHDVWRNTLFTPKIVAHESFHILQEAMTRKMNKRNDNIGDWLLTEGTAEYAGWMAVVDKGVLTYDEFKTINIQWARGGKKSPKTSDASGLSTGTPYAVGALAIDFLVGNRGVKIIGDYLENVYEMPWKEAFGKTFGMSVEEFYERFESKRSELGI